MSTLNICLFSKFCARLDGRDLVGFEGHKLQELLSYLLLHRDHSHSRESLASLLWANSSTSQSKRNLRQLLWQLQTALERQLKRTSARLLRVEPNCVHLDSQGDLTLDVAAFEQAFGPVQNIQGQDLDSSKASTLAASVQLYQGDLLEGWYEDWCIYERERLQNMFLTMLDKLMGYCEVNKEYETGISYGSRILSYDRAREHTHKQLMRLQYLAGNRTGALRQYERCTTALDEELGVKPARSTVTLYEQIRADHFESQARPSTLTESTSESPDCSSLGTTSTDAIEVPEASSPRLPEVLNRLREVQQALSDIQQVVQQDIQTASKGAH